MKNLIFFLLISVLFSAVSCSNEKIAVYDDLLGTYVHHGYDSNLRIYLKADEFSVGNPGIEFKKRGKIVHRDNFYGCGTPPIVYENVDGKWESISENTITIFSTYWGGNMESDWKIVQTGDTLKIEVLDSRYDRE